MTSLPSNASTHTSEAFSDALSLAQVDMKGRRCPIGFAMEMLGDRWTLLIIRDMALFQACRYSELQQSIGNISTNILANRLKQLGEKGLLEKFKDPDDGKSSIYLLTDKGLDLLPVLGHLVRWGMQYDEHSAVPSMAQAALNKGPAFLDERKEQLAQQRLTLEKKPTPDSKKS